MVFIKKSIANESTLNHDLTVEKLSCTNFKCNNILEIQPGSINPTSIGTTADSIEKLNDATNAGNSIFDLNTADQIVTVDKTFNNATTKFKTSNANNFETIFIESTQTTGNDAIGITFKNATGAAKRGLYKSNAGDMLCFFKEGTVEICFNKDIELKEIGAKYKINNKDILSETTLGPSVVNSSITSFGNLTSLTIENTNANLTLTSTSTGCNLNLYNGDKRINFDSAFSIFHSATNPTLLDFRNNANTLFRINNTTTCSAFGVNPNTNLSNTCLNIDSSLGTRGLLLPFIDNAQRGSLSPSEGLLFYNESNKDIEFWNGSAWNSISTHSADTSSIHGVNGILLGTTDVQNISNKTFHGTTTFEETNDIDNFALMSICSNKNRNIGIRFKNNKDAALTDEVGFYMGTNQKLRSYEYNQFNIEFDNSINLLQTTGSYKINNSIIADANGTQVAKNKSDNYQFYSSNGITEYISISSGGTDIKNGLLINGNAAQFALKNNLSAITDPGTDNTYDIGSHWLNTITDTYWTCVEKSPAVWKQIAYQESIAGFVTLAGNENISGIKTYSTQQFFNAPSVGLKMQPASGDVTLQMQRSDGTKFDNKVLAGKYQLYDSSALVNKAIYEADQNSFNLINGWYHKNGIRVVLHNNYSAVTDPLVTSDINSDYTVGSEWVNTLTDTKFSCLDNAAGNSRWYETRSENITFQEIVGNSATYFTVASFMTGSKRFNFFDLIITPGSATMSVRIYNLSIAAVEVELTGITGLAQIQTLTAITNYYSNPLTTLQIQIRKDAGGGNISCQTCRVR